MTIWSCFFFAMFSLLHDILESNRSTSGCSALLAAVIRLPAEAAFDPSCEVRTHSAPPQGNSRLG
ncbi:hypothetical protein [Zoogloea sp.]|uniref:hypothetical protein n=1 Tax=Zoogloea sp. TaxID=49181 RepID=UPI00260780B0|nr:hypothetical protein [uncultured Zoogloea sp.]